MSAVLRELVIQFDYIARCVAAVAILGPFSSAINKCMNFLLTEATSRQHHTPVSTGADAFCVMFKLFGCGGGGGGVPRGLGHTTCLCSFQASAAQKWKFPKLIFLILGCLSTHGGPRSGHWAHLARTMGPPKASNCCL